MRASLKGLIAALLLVSTLTVGGCQSNLVRAKTAQNQTNVQTKPDNTITPDGWLVINEETFIPIVDRLGEQLSLARQAYLKGDNIGAAIALREGATFLASQMPNTSRSAQANLNKASDELMTKASIVRIGEIDSVKELDRILIQAYQADVQHRWLFADESEWIPLIEMPQQYFMAAKQGFVSKDYSATATQILKGAELLKLESNRTRDSELKLIMLDAAHNLEGLTEEIKQGKINQVSELDRCFARAQLAVGEFLISKAQESESRGKLDTATKEIIAAYKQIQTASTWLGKDNTNLKQAQGEMNLVQSSLDTPNEVKSRKIEEDIAAINKQIALLAPELTQ